LQGKPEDEVEVDAVDTARSKRVDDELDLITALVALDGSECGHVKVLDAEARAVDADALEGVGVFKSKAAGIDLDGDVDLIGVGETFPNPPDETGQLRGGKPGGSAAAQV